MPDCVTYGVMVGVALGAALVGAAVLMDNAIAAQMNRKRHDWLGEMLTQLVEQHRSGQVRGDG